MTLHESHPREDVADGAARAPASRRRAAAPAMVEPPLPYGILNERLRFVRVNGAFAALTGLKPGRHAGRALTAVLPGLGAPLVSLVREALRDHRAVNSVVARHEPKQVSRFVATAHPLRGRGVTGMVGLVLDPIPGPVEPAREESDAASRRLRAVHYVLEAALSGARPDEMLRSVSKRVREVLETDTAAILLASGDSTELHPGAASGLEETWAQVTVPVGEGVAGRVAVTREPTVITDMKHADVFTPGLRTHIASLMVAPLMAGIRLVGVIQTGSVRPRQFTDDDLWLLNLVASRVAAAVELARLYEQAHFERTRWQATVESMLDPVVVCDARGAVVYMNDAHARLSGRPGADGAAALRRPDGTRFEHAELPQRRAALAGEAVRGVEVVSTGPGGERITVWNASPLRDEAGRPAGSVATGRDVTEQRRAERERERLLVEVQRHAAENEAILAAIPVGLAVYDAEGRILRQNAAAALLLDQGPADAPLTPVERAAATPLETPEGCRVLDDDLPVVRALRGEVVRGRALVLQRRDGGLWLSVSAAPIQAAGGGQAGAVATYADLTVVHELEAQREDLLRAVTHDLRAPLSLVLLNGQLLEDRLRSRPGTAADRERVAAIIEAGRRIEAMIQELADASRVGAGQLQLATKRLALRTFIAQVLRHAAGVIDPARVRLEVAPGVPEIQADPEWLERALLNILVNSVRCAPKGAPIQVSARPRGGEVLISVVDPSCGIAADEVAHAFEPYHRLKAHGRGQGLGLGLYIAKKLVEGHGGHLSLEADRGRGSVFSLSLRAADQLAAAG
ncbi:MAG TPA: PAS domain-containing protein [Polyangia bacterium]